MMERGRDEESGVQRRWKEEAEEEICINPFRAVDRLGNPAVPPPTPK